MREIPPLRILALRSVGPPGCNPEVTFGGACRRNSPHSSDKRHNDKETRPSVRQTNSNQAHYGEDAPKSHQQPDRPTLASRLLRSLRYRPVANNAKEERFSDVNAVPLPRRPYTGSGRPNANDVDLSHPWILTVCPAEACEVDGQNKTSLMNYTRDSSKIGHQRKFLVVENGNHAVDCLQSFIDSLVESGRADDSRLGVNFFREWVLAVVGEEEIECAGIIEQRKKKRRKTQHDSRPLHRKTSLPLGSLSLHNLSSASTKTFRSMAQANVGRCLGTLDLTGVHGVTDSILSKIVCSGLFPRLRRLSLKNCRKVTGRGVASLERLPSLRALDIGGCFNINVNDVVSLVQKHPGTKKGTFREIYASGLGWTDATLDAMVNLTAGHLTGLSVGFSPYLSGPGLILILAKVSNTLDRLAVPFCDSIDDATVTAFGKILRKLAALDIRGCSKVSSLSGLMEGRISNGFLTTYKKIKCNSEGETFSNDIEDAVSSNLFVLARYSGITKNSSEETMRLHQYDQRDSLTCILDGGGIGGGIRR